MIVVAATLLTACGSNPARNAASSGVSGSSTHATNTAEQSTSQTASPTPTPTPVPTLAVVASWFVDNHTHAEPMVVRGVTASSPDTLLVAFVASDSGQGPSRGGPPLDGSVRAVTGGGLTWTRRAHAHLATTKAPGVAEVWTAWARTPTGPFVMTVARSNTTGVNALCDNWSGGSGPDTCNGTVFVQALVGADPAGPIGAAGVAGVGEHAGRAGPIAVTLTVTHTGSIVEAVGADWSGAAARTLIAGQVMLHQDAATPQDDTYWVQGLRAPVRAPGPVRIGVQAPTDHDSNIAAVEIVPAPHS